MTRARRYVSRSAFARRVGVSPAAITKACKTSLRDALNRDRIDVEHPAAVRYAERHASNGGNCREPEQKSVEPDTNGQKPTVMPLVAASIVHDETEIGAYADMTIREIVHRYGTERSFKDWLEAHKKIEDVEEKRIKNEEMRGALISRDLVRRTIFSAWEDSNRRLLTDVPRTLVARMYGAALSDVPKEESEKVVKEIISGVLRQIKDVAVQTLEPND